MTKSFVFYLYVLNPDTIFKAAKSIRTKWFHFFSSKALRGFEENKHQTVLLCSKKKKTTNKIPPRHDGFFPALGRADIQCLLFTGSITITDEMEFVADPPAPSEAQYPQHPLHISQPGTGLRWAGVPQPGGRATCSASPHLTPLQLQLRKEAATEGRKLKYLPVLLLPSTAEPHSSPWCSMHQAASVAASKAFHWFLCAKPTCCFAAEHGIYPGEVHSFSGSQSPSQGPPNPVRHLLPR